MDKDRIVFLCGEKTILRPYCEETDLALLTAWYNAEATRSNFTTISSMFPVATSLMQTSMREKMLQKNPNYMIFVIERITDPGPIGVLDLHEINWIDRTAGTGLRIGIPKLRGKGFGTDAKLALARHAFYSLGLRMLRTSVLSFNERSIRALLRQGYREVGRVPDWYYRNGQLWDEVIFILTPEDLEKAQPRKT